MKKIILFLAAASFILIIFTGISFALDKFAYIDLSRTFGEYNKTKDFDKVLTDKMNSYETEREKKLTEFKQLEDKVNLLSEKEKEKKKAELNTKAEGIREFVRQKETDMRKEQDEKMKEILKDIEEAVKQYAEKEGYTLVFNDRVLIYENKSMDITDKIIEILNKGYKKQ